MSRLTLFVVCLSLTVASGANASEIFRYAGTGTQGYAGNGGFATSAKLNFPIRAAVAADGSVLIADESNNVIRRVNVDGKIVTVAGAGGPGAFAGDGGKATAARLNQPTGVAPLADGGFLIADRSNRRIRKVSAAGIITTVAGSGSRCTVTTGACGDGGAATRALLNGPDRIAVLKDGSFLISEDEGNKIRKVAPNGIISRFAGTGAACSQSTAACGDGGAARSARLNGPNSIAVKADGSVLIADSRDNRIRMVNPSGIMSTVAGDGNAGSFGNGIAATSANLNTPSSVALAPDGTIVIADSYSHLVRYVQGGIIRTLAGTADSPCALSTSACGDGGNALAANLNTPDDVVVQGDGSVLIADHLDHRIRVVSSRFGGAPIAHVVGKNLVNGAGKTVQLRGVNRAAFESRCTYSTQYADGPTDQASINAMASWEMTTVRLTLNEDCWLGLNGLPRSGNPAAYRSAVVSYVKLLRARGFYVIIGLHVTAPGTFRSTRIDNMPDASHAPAFWKSVATQFRADHGILFDPINEVAMASWNNPHPVPAGQWGCWRNGCTLDSVYGGRFTAAGMQSLVNTIRATKASQPIILGGLSFNSDQSGLLANLPNDGRHQLVASAHIYDFAASQAFVDNQFATTYQSLANRMPFLIEELGERYCDSGTAAYTNHVLSLVDAQRAASRIMGVLGWTWNARTAASTGWNCPTGQYGEGGPLLIRDYAGSPTVLGGVFFTWFLNNFANP